MKIKKNVVIKAITKAEIEYNKLTKDTKDVVDELASFADSEQHRISFGLKMLEEQVYLYNQDITKRNGDQSNRLIYVTTSKGLREYRKYSELTLTQLKTYLVGLDKAEASLAPQLDNIKTYRTAGKKLLKAMQK
jgi:hypothetical protein